MTEAAKRAGVGAAPRPLAAAGFQAALRQAAGLRCGRLLIALPDGGRQVLEGSLPGPQAVLRLHRLRGARRFLAGGALGFCEAYLDGDWSSPDPVALFVLVLRNGEALRDALGGRWWFNVLRRFGHRLNRNDRRGAQRNVARHYDLGNAFYARWLDASMTYSAAIFPTPDSSLECAQHAKYAQLARRLRLGPDHHLLEIGCGWGGFALYAARECGARVTAVTISRRQFDHVRALVQRSGLVERIEVRLEDYRQIRGHFDRIAAIEMFEAVGEAYWPVFFETLRARLAPEGTAAMQVITIADEAFDRYRRTPDFIQTHIFPGGMLPSPAALDREIRKAGLAAGEVAAFGADYARTLHHWQARFQAAWPEIEAMGFDRRFKRMWELYLAYCAAGFEAGRIDVRQFALRHA